MVDLFAVQPAVGLEEYLDPERFAAHHRALGARIAEIRARPGAPADAIAVWPEYVATFLVLAGRGRDVAGCRTVDQALRRVVLRHPLALASTLVRHRTTTLVPAVLTMLAGRAHDCYVTTFSAIARDLGVWLVAGSGLFPRYRHPGRASLVPDGAAVFNTSYTFAPSGALAGETRKVNLVPTQEDVLSLSAAPAGELSVLDTPAGRLGTLICYDGFREAHTTDEPGFVAGGPVMDRLGAQIVAQPSANAWAWDAPWAFNEPGEHLLRREQWFAEGMAAELAGLRSVQYVVNPQLVGDVLDAHFEAPSLILGRRGERVDVLAQSGDPHGEDLLHMCVEVEGPVEPVERAGPGGVPR